MQGQASTNFLNRTGATLIGGAANACAPIPDTIDTVLQQLAESSTQLMGSTERVADYIVGGSPMASPKTETADGSVMSRLKMIQGMLNLANADANRAKIALGLSL